MMKSGAPPYKVGILHRLLPIEIHGSQAELISKGYHYKVPGIISILFKEGMGPFSNYASEAHICVNCPF